MSADRYDSLLSDVIALLDASRRASARAVNAVMTTTYWAVGHRIVEHEQRGAARAEYGKGLLRRLAADLGARFGRGFSVDRLETARLFYLASVEGSISATVSRKSEPQQPPEFPLSWSHYVLILRRVKSNRARRFYELEALESGWTVRQLERQVATQFYERVALSRNKASMLRRGVRKRRSDFASPERELKDPFVLEFLGLKDEFSENELEAALVRELETLLLEMGRDFTFVGRQQRLRVGSEWFRVDLVFFHRRLRCLFIIELKLGHFKHADAGQMNLYLNYAREQWMVPGENPPVGVILCTSKDESVARYALEGLSSKVMAAEYRTKLPDERVLEDLMAQARREVERRSPKNFRRSRMISKRPK